MDSPMLRIGAVVLAVIAVACANLRHPLDDSETRPETETMALEEAGSTLDTVAGSVFPNAEFSSQTWSAADGCESAPFAPSQGEVGRVLIRTFAQDDVESLGSAADLLDDYEQYWIDEGETVSRSSADMDPGVVSRVNGIGYELVSIPPELELRAFISCY